MQTFNGKTAYIFGGSSGIGPETGKLLAAAGAHVFIFARMNNLQPKQETHSIGRRRRTAVRCSKFHVACSMLDVQYLSNFKQKKSGTCLGRAAQYIQIVEPVTQSHPP